MAAMALPAAVRNSLPPPSVVPPFVMQEVGNLKVTCSNRTPEAGHQCFKLETQRAFCVQKPSSQNYLRNPTGTTREKTKSCSAVCANAAHRLRGLAEMAGECPAHSFGVVKSR